MANVSIHRTGQLVPNKFHDGENYPGKAMTRSPAQSNNAAGKVTVVYYLSRNGQIGHPYITEVPLSSPQGLQLRDVIDALNVVRGQGMASMYSWSFKRRYRKGFVWQDLLDADFICPCNGHDYILKGSLLMGTYPKFQSYETTSPSASRVSLSSEINSCSEDSSSPPSMRRRSHSLSTSDGLDAHKDHNIKTSEQFASACIGMSVETERIEPIETADSLSDPSALMTRSRGSQVLERPTKSKDAAKIGDGMMGNEPSPARSKAYAPLLKMFLACGSRKLQHSPERQHQCYSSTAIQV